MTNNVLWDTVYPNMEPINSIPIPHILYTIRYLMDDRVQDVDTAIHLLDKIKHLRNDIEFLNWQAMVEYECRKYERAFNTSEKILSQLKNHATYFNAGRAAYRANQLEKSELYLRTCMELNPNDPYLLLDYSNTICNMGEFDRSLAVLDSINVNLLDYKHRIAVDFNRGTHLIRKGKFTEGMKCLELGRTINVWGSAINLPKNKQWDGTVYPGKTILIVGEGGIGDEIINSRFSKNIKEHGMNCIMSTAHNNTSMLSSIKTLDNVINNSEISNHHYDYYVPCMAIPSVMNLDITDIPSEKYIYAKQTYIEKHKLSTSKKLKVGIRFMGNPRYELELGRTIPIEYFESLSDLDIEFYSLQKDDGIKEVKIPNNIIDLSGKLETWGDTLGIIENLDLVITSCTSVAHASASLGKPTFILVPIWPYYTWSDMKKESYWYDSVTLYRQQKYNDWTETFIELKNDLKIKLANT